MKIKHKLGLLFTLLLLIPVSAVVIVALSWATENFERNALASVKAAVQLSAQQLSTELTVTQEALSLYTQSRELQSMQAAQFLPYLRAEVARLQPRYEKFIVGLPDGTFYNTAGGNPAQGMRRSFDDANPSATLLSLKKRDYWQATIDQNPDQNNVSFVSEPMISYTTGARQIVVAQSIVRQQEVVGLLAVTLNWEKIESYINELRESYFTRFEWPPRLMLTDREGNYWYHWNPEKIVHHLADENGQLVVDSSRQAMSLISNIKDEGIAEITKVYQNPLSPGVQALHFTTHSNDDEFYFIYDVIPMSGYVFATLVSRTELLTPLKNLKKKYLWLLGLALLIGSLAGLVMAKTLSTPIEKLTRAVEALKNNDVIPVSTTSGLDEINLLSQAFITMRETLSQRETELVTSESRLTYAMLGANDGLWDWDLRTNDVFYSPRWFSMLGHKPEDFKSRASTFLQLVHPDDKDITEKAFTNYLTGVSPSFRTSFRLKHASGHYVYILSRAQIVRDAETNEPLRLVGTHVDISEQVAFEEKIQAMNEGLEQRVADRTQDLEIAKAAALKAQSAAEAASLAKSRFLANMSHELRTPLNAINGFADRLVSRLDGNIEHRHMDALKTIARNGKTLLDLINDILDTQRIDSGEITLKYSQVMIPELFDQLFRIHKESADKKGIQLSCEYSTNIDQRSINADPVRLRQVLNNLLSNAIKFTQTGSISLIAAVDIHEHQAGMRFDIIDTGIGIEMSQLDNLFNPFTQIDDSSERSITGTGLGLTLVKLLTEMHNGLVSVKSSLGEGSTFSIWIPDKKP